MNNVIVDDDCPNDASDHRSPAGSNEAEMRAWRTSSRLIAEPPARPRGRSVADHRLTMGDYQVLVLPVRGRRPGSLRMCDLAGGSTCRPAASPAGSTAWSAPGWSSGPRLPTTAG